MATESSARVPCLLRMRMLRGSGRALCLCRRDTSAARVRAAVPFGAAAEAAAWWKACGERGSCRSVTAAQLSFSLTTAAAVKRLVLRRLLSVPCGDARGYLPALRLHFVGADITEGDSPASVVEGLRPLLLVLAALWQAAHIVLAGPGVSGLAARLQGRCVVVRPLSGQHKQFCLSLRADSRLYHELAELPWFRQPHLLCTYNSGFWGYDSWLPTLRYLARCTSHPCVSTAYNELEAEDDEDVLEGAGIRSWVWAPEPNPHASSVVHEPQPPMYRKLADNGVWQCFTGNTYES